MTDQKRDSFAVRVLTACRESRVAAIVRWVWRTLLSSRLYAILLAVVTFFADTYRTSTVRRILVGKDGIEKHAGSSCVYKVLAGLASAVVKPPVKLFCVLRNYYEGSFVQKLYDRFFHKPFVYYASGFAAFVCVFLFIVPHEAWSNTFVIFFAAVLFLVYALARSFAGENAAGSDVRSLWFSVLVFAFSLIVSTFLSYDVGDSVRILLFFVSSLVLCFGINACVRGVRDLDVVCGFLYAALTVTSAFAVVQRIIGVEADAALTDMALNEDMPGRVFSTLANPNNFAEFLVLFLPFALAFALNRKDKTQRIYALAGLLLPVGALLFTYSRSGWIAFAIAALIFVVLYDKKYLPVLLIACVAALPFLPKNILNRLLTIGNLEDTSSSYRVDIWTGCLRMLKDYWFTGVGLGTGGFAEIYPPYAVGESGVAPHSHMHFMEMLVELGALGFVSYVCMTFTLIRRSFVSAARSVPKEIRNVTIASASSMTGIILIGCFEYCWFYPRVMVAFFVCAGVCMAAARLAKPYRGN